LTALLKKNDIVFLDEKVHASIVDGCIASGVKMVVFEHNSINDLQKKVKSVDHRRGIIIVDGVYSIEGDIASLNDFYKVAEENDIPLMVDDAHGFGVMGEKGEGTSEHFGLNGLMDLEVASFGAALAGVGAFLACKKEVKDYLVHFSDGILYTTNLSPAMLGSVSESLRIIKSEPALRARLWDNITHLKTGLKNLGYHVGPSQSAVMTIEIGNERITDDAVKMLETNGVAVNTFRRPMVRRGSAKLRISVSAAHSNNDIDQALGAFKTIKPELDAKIADLI